MNFTLPIMLTMLIIIINPIHPMKLTLLLLMFSLMLFFNMTVLSNLMIYIYMMFMIMIGGIIIMILYFTSLIIFKKFLIKQNFLKVFFTMLIFMLLNIINFMMKNYPEIFEYFNNNENLNLNFSYKMFNLNNLLPSNNIMMMYSFNSIQMTLFCITILLLILYFVAKISSKLNKPLRLFKI